MKYVSVVISFIVAALFFIAAMGWIWFNFAIGWSVLKAVFNFIFGG
ncbi:hypothetical protein [Citrobacter phage CVT22]|uniref:Uncharacterized protein n=1 Tax=Citrobacter phage CVT22 TaxID=1622234 RepID=A0A0R6CMZ8_9CAUD|nr:hypothetical protein APL39_gp82 [Citrobacter phage CVT22]AJT60704.1 hypothetical protein [Citrobacter phage CVT22]